MAKRTVKPAAERRREILDAAQRLFFDEGYGATSVQRIIDVVGVSKGAFYHHFASKESVLEALIERLVAQGLDAAAQLLDRPELSPTEKLNAFFSATRRLRADQAPLMRRLIPILWMTENLLLRDRLQERTIEATVPLLAALIEEGREGGALDCIDAEGAAEVVLRMGTMINDAVARLIDETTPDEDDDDDGQGEPEENVVDDAATLAAVARFERRLAQYEQSFNRVLGLPDGIISLYEPGFAMKLLEA